MSRPIENPGYSALRRGRRTVPGQIYLLTFTTRNRAHLFADPDAALCCCRAIAREAHGQDGKLLAWVLMPDHWHGLLELGHGTSLSRWVARLKSSTTRALQGTVARPVWEKGFHDHALRRDEDLLKAAQYIVLNPVRAGLVSRCGLYPWWDAVWV